MSALRKKFFITLSVFILSIGLLVGVFWYLLVGLFFPIADKFSTSQQNIANYERDSKYYRVVIAQDLEESNPYLKKIGGMFYTPSRENGFQIILFFEDAAKRNNVKESINQPPETVPQVDVQVSGGLNNILTFLREIESDAYLLTVTRFAIAPSGSGYAATISVTLNTQ